jgi:hypothetical protein
MTVNHCTGYLVYPFLKMSGEQSFSLGLVCNFLKVYASIFNFLQLYESNQSKNSTFIFQFSSVREALYCNFMRPAHCKEMGIMTRCLPPAPQANRISTLIHGDPLLSTGFAVSFAVKIIEKMQGVGCIRGPANEEKEPQSLLVAALSLFACNSSLIAGTIAEDDYKDNVLPEP